MSLTELFNFEKIEVDDLPEISRDKLIFKIEEKEVEGITCIVVYESDNLFLIRSSGPDIQDQCIEIEKILTKKFGNKQLEIVNLFK